MGTGSSNRPSPSRARSLVDIDTRRIAGDERADYWHASVCDEFVPLVVAPMTRDVEGRISGSSIAEVRLRRIAGSEHRFVRRPIDISRGDPEIMHLLVLNRGRTTVEQDGRDVALRPGELMFYDSSRPFEFRTRGGFDYTILLVPKSLLGLSDRTYRSSTARPIPLTDGLGSIARDLINSIARHDIPEDAAQHLILQQTLLGVVAALMPSSESGATSASTLLALAKDHIGRHLADPNLSPATVASVCGISTSYLHRLFAQDGHGVAAYIREQRLQAAYRHLISPAGIEEPIAAVGRRCGLGDPAHFNRLFKARFDMPPGELRRTAAGGNSAAIVNG